MVGIYLGPTIRMGELSLGRFDNTKFNDMTFFHAYDYKGQWEMAWNTIEYKTGSSHLRSQRGILLSNIPFILFNTRKFPFYL